MAGTGEGRVVSGMVRCKKSVIVNALIFVRSSGKRHLKRHFLQLVGTPMGTKATTLYATLFLITTKTPSGKPSSGPSPSG